MTIENNRWMRKLRGGFWINIYGSWARVLPHGLYSLPELDSMSIEAHRRWWTF